MASLKTSCSRRSEQMRLRHALFGMRESCIHGVSYRRSIRLARKMHLGVIQLALRLFAPLRVIFQELDNRRRKSFGIVQHLHHAFETF